jgi:hypothetical protein
MTSSTRLDPASSADGSIVTRGASGLMPLM